MPSALLFQHYAAFNLYRLAAPPVLGQIESTYSDFEGRTVLDLGCGTVRGSMGIKDQRRRLACDLHIDWNLS
jgi:hypothetical protein